MPPLTPKDLPDYSYEDYRQWEGDWELIQGVPYAMAPSPVKLHQQLVGYLFREVSSRTEICPDCEVLLDEDWKLDSKTVLRPDLSLVCGDRNPDYISKTPELIFEVLSLATARRDEELKFRLYQEEGVGYYVLVYPDELLAKIYHNGEGSFHKVAERDGDRFHFEALSCPFELDFEAVFGRFRKR